MSSADCNFINELMFLNTCRAIYALLLYQNIKSPRKLLQLITEIPVCALNLFPVKFCHCSLLWHVSLCKTIAGKGHKRR